MSNEILLNNNEQKNENNKREEIIVKYNGNLSDIEKNLNADVELLNENYAIVTLDKDQIPLLYKYKQIEYIEEPKTLTYSLNQSIISSCISPVQNNLNLSGKGVIVAIIDSGIDYTHPDFRNNDGTSRILFLWDQTGTGQPPNGFKVGSEYTKSQIDEALKMNIPFESVPQFDAIGHGTAVAGIAGGNGRASNGQNKGVAPESSFIIVKLGQKGRESFTRTVELMRGIKYVISKAEDLNMPISINISFGTNNGSHDGRSLFETYIDDMCQQWKNVIVVATGNEGSSAHHYKGKLKTNETVDVDFITTGNLQSFFISLWKNFVDSFTFELIAPNRKSSGVINYSQVFKRMVLDNVNIFIYYGQPTHYNVDQEIFIQFVANSQYIPQGIWKLRINGRSVVEGNFNIWMPVSEASTVNSAFLTPSVETTLTLPSTSQNVISVGGYNDRINSTADFSGRGYTRNDVYVKPDLVAPAVNILTAKSGGGYDAYTGTSMAAPFVTGSAALMMEWGIIQGKDSFLYGQRIKAFLRAGAKRNNNVAYPNNKWGYGSLCLDKSMSILNDFLRG